MIGAVGRLSLAGLFQGFQPILEVPLSQRH